MPVDVGQDYGELKKALGAVEEPRNKGKYVIVDLSMFKELKIDEVTDVVKVSTGMKCK